MHPASLDELVANVSSSSVSLIRRDAGLRKLQRMAEVVGLALASLLALIAFQCLLATIGDCWTPDVGYKQDADEAYPWQSVPKKDVKKVGPTYRLNWRSGLQQACSERGMLPLEPTSSTTGLFSFLIPAVVEGKPARRAIVERHNGVPPGCLGGKRALWIHLCANDVEALAPKTFLRPLDLRKALEHSTADSEVPPPVAEGLWFLKHSNMDRNEGVSCFKGAENLLDHWENSVPKADRLRYVAQVEVQRPLLLNDRKMMIRAYVVTIPAGRCFLNRELLLKCHPRPYDPETADAQVQIISCTQYDGVEAARGTDWCKYHKVWSKISKMLKACLGPKTMVGGKSLAEYDFAPDNDMASQLEDLVDRLRGNVKAGTLKYNLIGVDIIVDEDLRCWLIEMNPGPQMGIDPKEGLASEIRANVMEDLCALLVDPLLRMAQASSKTRRWSSLRRMTFTPAVLTAAHAKRRGFVELK